MTLSIDVFWSFRSPYSYLATPRLCAMAEQYDLTVNIRPVYPLAVRAGAFFSQVNPLWVPYLMRDHDAGRRKARPCPISAAAPIRWSWTSRHAPRRRTSPISIALTRLGCAAAETRPRPRLPQRDQPHDLVGAAQRLERGLAPRRRGGARGLRSRRALDAKIEADPDKYEAIILANQDAHKAVRPLGRSDHGVRGRAVLRAGSPRRSSVALQQKGLQKR